MTVVDASIIVRLLLNREQDEALRERFAQESIFHAPALIDAEVASAVRGLLRAGSFTQVNLARASEMLDDFTALPIIRYPMLPLLRESLHLHENFTAYDALYLVLAQALGAPLLTADQKFAKAPIRTSSIETWTQSRPTTSCVTYREGVSERTRLI